jgi:hypothetical protein
VRGRGGEEFIGTETNNSPGTNDPEVTVILSVRDPAKCAGKVKLPIIKTVSPVAITEGNVGENTHDPALGLKFHSISCSLPPLDKLNEIVSVPASCKIF